MKLWTPLCMIFLSMVLLSALGGIKKTPVKGSKMFIEECLGDPSIRECARKCSKTWKCLNVNHTCCWTYCGYICWKNTEI